MTKEFVLDIFTLRRCQTVPGSAVFDEFPFNKRLRDGKWVLFGSVF